MPIENDLNRIANALEEISGSLQCFSQNSAAVLKTTACTSYTVSTAEAEKVVEIPAKRGRPAKIKTAEYVPDAEDVKADIASIKLSATPNLGLDDEEVAETPTPKAAVKPAAKATALTIENVRTAVAKHVNKNGTDSLKTIMAEFDAKKIVDVAVLDYPALIERLEA